LKKVIEIESKIIQWCARLQTTVIDRHDQYDQYMCHACTQGDLASVINAIVLINKLINKTVVKQTDFDC